MTTIDLFADTPVYKLHRQDNPDTSKEAAKKVESGELKKLVYDTLVEAGENGMTMGEVCEATGVPLNSLSPRSAPLEREGLIFYRGDRRDGSRVMRTVNHMKFAEGHCQKCGLMLLDFYDLKCQRCK